MSGPLTERNVRPPSNYTAQVNVLISAAHSVASRAFVARKLMPNVPNFAALEACGAPLNTSPRQVIANPMNPAATTVA